MSTLGFSVVLSVAIGAVAGWYLDKHVFGTSPWLTYVFLALGVGAAVSNVVLVIKRAQRIQEKA